MNDMPHRLRLLRWDECASLPALEWLVKGILGKGAMSVVYGEPSCGKSFFALHLAICIARGMQWFGRQVRFGAVLYIAAEGGIGMRERLQAFALHHDIDPKDTPLFLLPDRIDLMAEDGDVRKVIDAIRRIAETFDPGNKPDFALIVVDTLARVFGGGNENAAEDMNRVIANCDSLRSETGAHVMLIHHSGKDAARGARGSNTLKAAVDTEIEVSKDATSGVITAEVTKQRDAAKLDAFNFQLEPVEVGVDEDGDLITSCVVVAPDAPQTRSQTVPTPKENLALEALYEAVMEYGEDPPASLSLPSGIRAVKTEKWKEEMFSREILNAVGNPREQFNRIRDGLMTKGRIMIRDGLVWAVPSP